MVNRSSVSDQGSRLTTVSLGFLILNFISSGMIFRVFLKLFELNGPSECKALRDASFETTLKEDKSSVILGLVGL